MLTDLFRLSVLRAGIDQVRGLGYGAIVADQTALRAGGLRSRRIAAVFVTSSSALGWNGLQQKHARGQSVHAHGGYREYGDEMKKTRHI